MPRMSRIKEFNQTYHVTQRGNNRENVFESDEDKLLFLETLFTARIKFNIQLYAYCIMDNHYHILFSDDGNDISKVMSNINWRYSRIYNFIHKRSGHVFQERFFSEIIMSEMQLYRTINYIHENPIRAGIVYNESDYCWSSFR